MQHIESNQNQWLKKIKALQQKKCRQQYGQFVLEGGRFLQEALDKQAQLEVVLIAEDHIQEAEQWLKDYDGTVLTVKKGLLEKALNTVTPQGVAAIASKPDWSHLSLADQHSVLVVDGVQDPGNLGTIIRTALASGADAVYCLKGTVDLYNDKVLRATMGAVFTQPVMMIEDHEIFLEMLRQEGFQTIVADIRGEVYHDQLPYPKKAALVVSNEANGPQLVKEGDHYVKIPLHGGAESLNVAVAAGILLYELERRKRK